MPKTIENRLGGRTISRYDLEQDALWRITGIQKSGEAEASAMAQKAALARRNSGDTILNSGMPFVRLSSSPGLSFALHEVTIC